MVLIRPWMIAILVASPLVSWGCQPASDCTATATCSDPVGPDGAVTNDDAGMTADATAADGGLGADSGLGGSSGGGGADAFDELPTLDVVIPEDAPPCPTSSTCVDPVPTGWAGPLALSDQTGGPPAPTPPDCPSSFPTVAVTGGAAPTGAAATCGCTCGAVSGGACASTLALYSDSSCTTLCGTKVTTTSSTDCVGGGCAGAQWAMAGALPSGGTCTPSPTSTVPSWAFSRTGRACEVKQVTGGCAAGAWCVPSPPPPFSAKLCIAQAGDVACPAGGYSQKVAYYATAQDTRGCSPCTCGSADGGACSGESVDVFTTDNGACGGAQQTVTSGSCVPLGFSAQYAQAHTPGTLSGGSCAPSPVSPNGMLTPSGPTTVCCQP